MCDRMREGLLLTVRREGVRQNTTVSVTYCKMGGNVRQNKRQKTVAKKNVRVRKLPKNASAAKTKKSVSARVKKISKNVSAAKKMKSVNVKRITKNVSAAKTKKSVNVNSKILNVRKAMRNVSLRNYWKSSSVMRKKKIARLY